VRAAADAEAAAAATARRRRGETQDEWALRRTKEFNEATRQRPQDLKLWLEFAAFQVTAGS
jgi:hypothetical protein